MKHLVYNKVVRRLGAPLTQASDSFIPSMG